MTRAPYAAPVMESSPLPPDRSDEPETVSVLVLRAWSAGTAEAGPRVRVTRVDDVQSGRVESSFVTVSPERVLEAVEHWLMLLQER